MKKTIAYAIVDEKGKTISNDFDRRYYIYKQKKDTLLDMSEYEKVIKVEIKEVK